MSLQDSPFDIPDFEKKTTEKMANYYIVGYRCQLKLMPQYAENRERMAQIWKAREQAWQSDPEKPSNFPKETLSLQMVNDYYAKCDAFCDREPSTHDVNGLVDIFFASNFGAYFIASVLLRTRNHPLKYKIPQEAGRIAVETFLTLQEIRTLEAGGDFNHAPMPTKVFPGEVLHYKDANDGDKILTIRVKDHGSSAMKGEFFVVTTIIDEDQDDDTADREVPADEMHERIQRRVEIE
ncbi:hypothetical protein CPB84DRAFT_1842996 [Gymnopilus junonius]|uniref:Uncharacterized protein n=1 Tax=Gymnopilus junonius TaxID=109634 RepID=A0A9P5NV86_GYMJU|nr:hypothetical protein CPB84DRAFT_1842996 [Gymnopilus junonius]